METPDARYCMDARCGDNAARWPDNTTAYPAIWLIVWCGGKIGRFCRFHAREYIGEPSAFALCDN